MLLALGCARVQAQDIQVVNIQTLGKLASPFSLPLGVVAAVRNNGPATVANQPVTLTVAGANTFTRTTSTGSLAPGATQLVAFDPYPSALNQGTNTLTVSVPPDTNNGNNTASFAQQVTDSRIAQVDESQGFSGGLSGGRSFSSELATKFTLTQPLAVLNEVKLTFINQGAAGSRYVVVVYDAAGAGGTPGNVLYSSGTLARPTIMGSTGQTAAVAVPVLGLAVPSQFYVAVGEAPTSTADYSTVSLATQVEDPLRPATNYYRLSSQDPWVDLKTAAQQVRLAIEVGVGAGPAACSTPPVVVTSFPYVENFDDAPAPTLPCGVRVLDANQDGRTWAVAAAGARASTPNALVYSGYPASGAEDWFFSPPLQLRAGYRYQLEFRYRGASVTVPEALEVKYGPAPTPASQTTQLYVSTNILTSVYLTTRPVEVNAIEPATTGTYYLGFRCFSAAGAGGLYLDEVRLLETPIQVVPPCEVPQEVAAGNVTPTGATITFSGPTTGTGYTYWLLPKGAPAPATGGTAATGAPLVLTGLTPSTSYDVYLQANCGATDQSALVGPVTFTTLCNTPPVTVTSFPYLENFDNIPAGSLPCGVRVLDANQDGRTWLAVGDNDGSPPNALHYRSYTGRNADDWFFTPPLRLRAGYSYQLQFRYRGVLQYAREVLEVKYGPAPTPVGQTTQLYVSTSILTSVYLTSSPEEVKAITPATTGTYYLGFRCFTAPAVYAQGVYGIGVDVDEVRLTETPITGLAALSQQIGLYPNPGSGIFSLDARQVTDQASALQVTVTNAMGQTMYAAHVKNGTIHPLDLSGLATGLYLVKVQKGAELAVRKLVIE